MKIIGADERLAEPRGVKALIVGPDRRRQDVAPSHARSCAHALRRHRSWRSRRAGSCRSTPLGSTTGRRRATWRAGSAAQIHRFPRPLVTHEAHFEASAARSRILIATTPFSSTASPRSAGCRFARPNSSRRRSRARGAKDTRGAYGLHAREMLLWLHQLQHARGKNVVFVGILESVTDEFNRAEFALQMEGRKDRPRAARHRRPDHHDATGSTSATASQCARSSARLPIPGTFRRKIAPAGSSRSRSRTSAS